MADHYIPPGTSGQQDKKKRDLLSVLGMVAVAGAAAFTSYSGLTGLAEMAGWPSKLALMLPITIDAYAMTATRVWLSPARLTKKARAWARRNAIGAISMSVLGNTIYHAASAHVLTVTWPVVVGISAIPSIVLGLTVHLWHTADDLEPEPTPKQSPGPAIAEPEAVRAAYPILGDPSRAAAGAGKPSAAVRAGAAGPIPAARGSQPRPAAPRRAVEPAPKPDKAARDAETLDAARKLNDLSWDQTGRPISARQLEKKLSIGSHPARALAKQLADERGHNGAQSAPAAPIGPAPGQTPAAVEPQGAQPATGTLGAVEPHPSAAFTDVLPGPRPAPVVRANGAETTAP